MSAISNPNANPRVPIPAYEGTALTVAAVIDALADAIECVQPTSDPIEPIDPVRVATDVAHAVLDAILSAEGPSSESVLAAALADLRGENQ